MRFLERRDQMNDTISRYSRTPVNKRLKYTAYTLLCMTAVSLLALLFLMDYISDYAFHLIRGFAGTFAIISIILILILYYRCWSAYWKDKNSGLKDQDE